MADQNNKSGFEAGLETALAANGPAVAAIRAVLPEALAIYAFGSRVNDTAHAESDLDLAVLTAGYAEPLRLWELAGELADMVGCPVDLLDMRAATTVMQYRILQTGRRLWGEELTAGLFECFVLSEKTALDCARAGLLTDILKRGGSVYGR